MRQTLTSWEEGFGRLSPTPTPEQRPTDLEKSPIPRAEDTQALLFSDPHLHLLILDSIGKPPKLLLTFQIWGDHPSHSALMGTVAPESLCRLEGREFFGCISAEEGKSPLTVAEPKRNQLGENKC